MNLHDTGERQPAQGGVAADRAGGAWSLGNDLRLAFHGNAGEYFRIWAVNLCLTLVTLGVFSAWAKVRKKRYFYSHTTLDGTPFQYLGQPGPILRGRLIAVTLFLIYYSSTHFLPSLFPYVVIAGTVLAPWVLVRSLAFNARYSAFRNMTFRFDGTYGDALQRLHGWGLIPALVVLTVFRWFGHDGWSYVLYGAAALTFPFWQQRLRGFIVEGTSYGGKHGVLSLGAGRFFGAYLSAGLRGIGVLLLMIVVLGALGVVLKTLTSDTLPIAATLLVMYGSYVWVSAHLQARITNLVWNHTQLGPLRFRSSLSSADLGKLYLSNTLAILASAGLLIPWAVVRTIEYRVAHLLVLADGELGEFRAEHVASVPATGAELGALFDLDFSL